MQRSPPQKIKHTVKWPANSSATKYFFSVRERSRILHPSSAFYHVSPLVVPALPYKIILISAKGQSFPTQGQQSKVATFILYNENDLLKRKYRLLQRRHTWTFSGRGEFVRRSFDSRVYSILGGFQPRTVVGASVRLCVGAFLPRPQDPFQQLQGRFPTQPDHRKHLSPSPCPHAETHPSAYSCTPSIKRACIQKWQKEKRCSAQ